MASLTDRAFDSLETALSEGTKYFLAYKENGRVVAVDSGGVPQLHNTLDEIIPGFVKYQTEHPELDVGVYAVSVSYVKQPVIMADATPRLLK